MATITNPATGIIEDVETLPENHEAAADLRAAHAEFEKARDAYFKAVHKRLDAVERYADSGGGPAGVGRIVGKTRPRGHQLILAARDRTKGEGA